MYFDLVAFFYCSERLHFLSVVVLLLLLFNQDAFRK